MIEDPEDRFELPRKFLRGVIRRERCSRADVEALSVTGPAADSQGFATWRSIDRVVAEDGPAAAVRAFAETVAAKVDFAGYNWGRGSWYDSPIRDRRWPLVLRLLDLVRSASDAEYAEALAMAEKMRAEYTSPAARAGMAVLAVDRPEWCSADVADYSGSEDAGLFVARVLMVAASTQEQARELGRRVRDWEWVNDDRRAEGTFLATVGGGADEFLVGCLATSRWHALNLLPKLPSEVAVRALIGELGPKDAQAALLEAAKRFPRRVLRLLAAAEPGTQVDYALRLHVAAQPEMARGEVAALSGDARGRVEGLLNSCTRLRIGSRRCGRPGRDSDAASADLPSVLVTPPWEDRASAKPLVLKGLPIPAPVFCWPSLDSGPHMVPELASSLDEAEKQARIVQIMAERLSSEYEPYSEAARTFFRRYPAEAVRQLLPGALGSAGSERRVAEAAVRFVAREGLADVVAVASEFGAEAGAAAQALLDRRGLDAFPKSMPPVPLWADPASLPGILVAGRGAALPASAVRIVVQMLTISSRREIAPYGGIEIVKEFCDASSLAEFAWGLFQNWAGAGYPTKKVGWAFDVLLWFGDDETARRLAPLVRAWPGEGGSARAAVGVDVLAAVGGDAGVREVYDISQRSSFGALREAAAARIAAVAAARGLSAEQFEDRLVLDLGAGADGTLSLDYGARRFTVGFDEYLHPYVADSAGRRRAGLPKPTAKDDAELAGLAQERFAGLKKDAKTLAVRQAARLELAMVSGRRWSEAEFRALFVAHPLMRLLGRRLVWGVYSDSDGGGAGGGGAGDDGGGGALRAAFRIAEDGTFADVADERFVVGVGHYRIGVVHPITLGADLPRWAEICHDYEIIQPFPQVGRPTFALTPTERTATHLERFHGAQLPTDRFLTLHRRPGWGATPEWNAGRAMATGRRLPENRILIVRITPGYSQGSLAATPHQTIQHIRLSPADAYGRQPAGTQALPLGLLSEVEASEIIADLTAAVGA